MFEIELTELANDTYEWRSWVEGQEFEGVTVTSESEELIRDILDKSRYIPGGEERGYVRGYD